MCWSAGVNKTLVMTEMVKTCIAFWAADVIPLDHGPCKVGYESKMQPNPAAFCNTWDVGYCPGFVTSRVALTNNLPPIIIWSLWSEYCTTLYQQAHHLWGKCLRYSNTGPRPLSMPLYRFVYDFAAMCSLTYHNSVSIICFLFENRRGHSYSANVSITPKQGTPAMTTCSCVNWPGKVFIFNGRL